MKTIQNNLEIRSASQAMTMKIKALQAKLGPFVVFLGE
jgi:hypothetical protein